MSRIGKKAISIPQGVKVDLKNQTVTVQGPKGKLEFGLGRGIVIRQEAGKVLVERSGDDRSSRALHGLARAMINNMIIGVSQGFHRALEINGVGYRAELTGKKLVLYLGYSQPIEYAIPAGVDVVVEKPTRLVVKSIDKELLGRVAAKIHSFRDPDPYKAKGISFEGEVIRRKAGKKAIS